MDGFDFPFFRDLLVTPALVTSPTLGLLIGAFYGWRRNGATSPVTLWIVGLAWLISIGVLGFVSGPFTIESQLARTILWTLLCAAIGLGRLLRLRFEAWRIHVATKKLNPDGDPEQEAAQETIDRGRLVLGRMEPGESFVEEASDPAPKE